MQLPLTGHHHGQLWQIQCSSGPPELPGLEALHAF